MLKGGIEQTIVFDKIKLDYCVTLFLAKQVINYRSIEEVAGEIT
jgi:hypothetical protein